MSIFNELKRRNVIRVGFAYVVMAWLIIQVVETILPLFGLGDGPARLVVIVLAVCFIPVLIIAWAFELTPDGLIRDGDVDRDQSIARGTGKKLDRVIMVVLAVALGFFTFDKFVLAPQRDAELVAETTQKVRSDAVIETYGDKSIAVLPFADMSQTGDQQYLSDGLAEELLNLLVKVKGLRVASRSSTFNLRDAQLSISEIAKKLNVAHILEGSVRLIDNDLRVTVQLIEAGSDTHVWSENYDRKFENIFKIQDDIAARVVDELKVNLMGDAPVVEEIDPEAYQMYLQAKYLMRRTNPEESFNVIELLEQVVELEPDYFIAWSRLGDIYQRQAIWAVAPKEEALAKSRAANKRAAEIEPDSKYVHSRMGWMAIRWDQDLEQAAIHIQRAVDLTEEPIEKIGIANDLLRHLGRHEYDVKLMEYWVEENPTDARNNLGLARAYLADGQFKKSIRYMRTALTLQPGIESGQGFLAYALLEDGQYEEALKHVEMEESTGLRLPLTVMILDELDRHDEAQLAFDKLIQDESTATGWQAEIYLRRGDFDKAFEILNSLSPENEEIGWQTLGDSVFEPLHDDPRWQTLVDKVSLVSVKPDHIVLNLPTLEELQ